MPPRTGLMFLLLLAAGVPAMAQDNVPGVIARFPGPRAICARKGIAVVTMGKGGLMYEASVGGQKFSYKPGDR